MRGNAYIEDSYLEEVTQKTYERILIKEDKCEIILNLKEFNKEHEAIKSRLILYSIKKLNNTNSGIERVHINDIISLCKNNIGNKYLTPNKHIKVFINKGKMYFFVTKKT